MACLFDFLFDLLFLSICVFHNPATRHVNMTLDVLLRHILYFTMTPSKRG